MKACKSYADTHRAGPGASTVLLILLVMCLAMLGALSLSVARNDLAVTRRAVEAETDWYIAASASAVRQAETDEALRQAREACAQDTEAWQQALSGIDGYDSETGMIVHDIPVDEYRTIHMVIRPLEAGNPARYEIIEHAICISSGIGGEYDQF